MLRKIYLEVAFATYGDVGSGERDLFMRSGVGLVLSGVCRSLGDRIRSSAKLTPVA